MREIIFTVFLMGIIVSIAVWFSSISCEEKAISFQSYKHGLFSGCMVKHNGKWLPLDNIRGFDDN